MIFPPFLYRGDADLQNSRQLRQWRRGHLLTNMSNGGSGREIFSVPITDLIRRHVDTGWEKTHFLSFTESYARAEYFAGVTDISDYHITDRNDWDAAIVTIDTSCFRLEETYESGVYRCHYDLKPDVHCRQNLNDVLAYYIPRQVASAYRQHKPVSVLVINLVSFLSDHQAQGISGVEVSLIKAIRDREWLILPLYPAVGIPGEYTAALDISCISKFECFKWGSVVSGT